MNEKNNERRNEEEPADELLRGHIITMSCLSPPVLQQKSSSESFKFIWEKAGSRRNGNTEMGMHLWKTTADEGPACKHSTMTGRRKRRKVVREENETVQKWQNRICSGKKEREAPAPVKSRQNENLSMSGVELKNPTAAEVLRVRHKVPQIDRLSFISKFQSFRYVCHFLVEFFLYICPVLIQSLLNFSTP